MSMYIYLLDRTLLENSIKCKSLFWNQTATIYDNNNNNYLLRINHLMEQLSMMIIHSLQSVLKPGF